MSKIKEVMAQMRNEGIEPTEENFKKYVKENYELKETDTAKIDRGEKRNEDGGDIQAVSKKSKAQYKSKSI